MSSVKKKPKFDPLLRGRSMNRSLRKKDRKRRLCDAHVGIQDKLEREIKLRDGASRMLAACTHEDQLLEVAKTLHTSNARMYTYMAELQKLKTAEIMEKVMDEEGCETESKICRGRVAISDIRIPLMWSDAAKFSGAKVKDFNRYAVFCLVRVGSEVQDTELVCMDKTTTDLNFRDIIVFEDTAHNFKMDIEIHAFPMAGEPLSAPTPQKLLSRLNRSIGKSEGKRIRDRLKESPAANMHIGPQYEKLGSLTLDYTCIDDHIKSHDITKVILPNGPSMRAKPLLPLYGSLTCRLVAQPKCVTEKAMTGFLHSMEIGTGVPCWSYMWCEVKAGKLLCWMNPEDVSCKNPQCSIDLMVPDLKVQEVEKLRQKRPNSFQIRDFENRHLFSASTKDEMTRWIRNIRQHRNDCSAWNRAYLPNKMGARPMFIASPQPYNSPAKLLFDSPSRNAQIYKQLSMDSPARSDDEAVSIGDLVKKTAMQAQSLGDHSDPNAAGTPWAGLFNGALNRSATKVTKLKDVQNTMNNDTPKKGSRLRTKSFDGILSSMRSSKNKKEFAKPPVPRRPSEERVRERQKHREKAAASLKPAKNEGFKSCFASESCSETYPSDVGLSSDDVFLSSDDTLLDSPHLPKSSASKRRGKKKRKAPMPPSSSSHEAKNHTTKPSVTSQSQTKASLSSASSVDDNLDRKIPPRKPPRPEMFSGKSKLTAGESASEERKSQSSLTSDYTHISNASSGYKSDSEGIPRSPHANKNHPNRREKHCYEVVVLDKDVQARKDKTRIRVLPRNILNSVESYTASQARSQSLGSDTVLGDNSYDHVNDGPPTWCKREPQISSLKAGSSKSLTPRTKPVPTPRRSYLTAVESSKVESPTRYLYNEPPDPPNSNEDPNYEDVEALYAKPIAKPMRVGQSEAIYAQVDKSKKRRPLKGETDRNIVRAEAQRDMIKTCMLEVDETDKDTVYV